MVNKFDQKEVIIEVENKKEYGQKADESPQKKMLKGMGKSMSKFGLN